MKSKNRLEASPSTSGCLKFEGFLDSSRFTDQKPCLPSFFIHHRLLVRPASPGTRLQNRDPAPADSTFPTHTHKYPMKKRHTLLAMIVALGAISTITIHAADEKPVYPLTTCVVSGDDLNSAGKPHIFTYKGKEVRLCCKDCKEDFDKDPATYMKKIEAAQAAASAQSGAHAGHQH